MCAVDKSFDYQRGFSDGFRKGYSRAIELFQDLIHRAVNCIPNHYTIVADQKAVMNINAVKKEKNGFIMFCDTGAYQDGKCNEGQTELCPEVKSICCIECDIKPSDCIHFCTRIRSDK
jgi:hypothetical protein